MVSIAVEGAPRSAAPCGCKRLTSSVSGPSPVLSSVICSAIVALPAPPAPAVMTTSPIVSAASMPAGDVMSKSSAFRPRPPASAAVIVNGAVVTLPAEAPPVSDTVKVALSPSLATLWPAVMMTVAVTGASLSRMVVRADEESAARAAPPTGLSRVMISVSLPSLSVSSVTAMASACRPLSVKVSVPLVAPMSAAVMPAPEAAQSTLCDAPPPSASPARRTLKVAVPADSATLAASATIEKALPSLARTVMVTLAGVVNWTLGLVFMWL